MLYEMKRSKQKNELEERPTLRKPPTKNNFNPLSTYMFLMQIRQQNTARSDITTNALQRSNRVECCIQRRHQIDNKS